MAGRLIYLGIFAFPLAVVLALLPGYAWVATYRAAAIPFQEAIGAVVAGAGIGILGLGGRLSQLALGFQPVVRVALGVDNWLREHPRNANPTARICGRYVSLLRYIAQWKDEQGHGYDALIVFAHSQGTVVTADLLRFLEVEARARGSYAAYDDTLAGLDRMKPVSLHHGLPVAAAIRSPFPVFVRIRSHRIGGGSATASGTPGRPPMGQRLPHGRLRRPPPLAATSLATGR